MTLKGKSRLETAGKILPQLSPRFLTGKILEGLVLLAVTLIPKLYHRGAIFRRLRQIAKKHGLPFHTTAHVLSAETVDFIRRQQPDLIITLVHQILKAPLLGLPRLGIINIHPGLLPQFKGIQPYFWELSEGSPEAGATLHLIEDIGIDTGRILAQKSYPTARVRSVHLNYYLTARTVAALLPATVQGLADGTLIPTAQAPHTGNYFKWPDSAAYDRLSSSGRRLFSFRDLFAILTGKHD
jgi:methionyl-tRNA formyltransferase